MLPFLITLLVTSPILALWAWSYLRCHNHLSHGHCHVCMNQSSTKTAEKRWRFSDTCYLVWAGAFVWVPVSFFMFYYIAAQMHFPESISDRFLLLHLIANIVVLLVCALMAALSGKRWSWLFVILNILVIVPDVGYLMLGLAFVGHYR